MAGKILMLFVLACWAGGFRIVSLPAAQAQTVTSSGLAAEIDRRAAKIESKAISWRRDLHEHQELSNREFRTAKIVADHLRNLGLEVRTGVAHTGVIGLLRGKQPGPVVALRADMDALPVTEEVDLPFAFKVRATYNGRETGVMHACGHDMHTAILMAVAEVLSGLRGEFSGSIKFIFQPAEEGAPEGEEGGAHLMIQEGALANPRPEAIFGLHVGPAPLREISYRPGALAASSDSFKIVVHGRQSHGALPWAGVDPIPVAAQIILGLQTITSRQTDFIRSPVVVTVGSLHGGVRNNIIPDDVEMEGTIRAFDTEIQAGIHDRIRRAADMIAKSAGASAEVIITSGTPVVFNDPALTDRMLPTLKRVARAHALKKGDPSTTSEDFSFYQKEIPGMFFGLGVIPKDTDPAKIEPNHSPRFVADEGAMIVGIRTLAHLAVDFLQQPAKQS